jgi:DNA-binding transcriptional regulator YhcF (GntR family)
MTAQSAVFSALSIKPHKTRELISKLPYTEHAIYKALRCLADKGLIEKRRQSREVLVEISRDYATQKLRQVYIKALTFGIDPEMLTRDSTLTVWKQLDAAKTLKELQEDTGFSYLWVRNIVRFLEDSGLVVYEKRKPMIAVLNKEHELNTLLRQYIGEEKEPDRIYLEGTVPFEWLVKTPAEIERILYQKIDGSLTIKDTGFTINGEDKLSVVESVDKELTLEELFLHEIETVEGVENICIRLVESGRLDYVRLLELAEQKEMVNVVGCYLDILNDIKELVSPEVIGEFQKNVSKRKATFLKEEKRYGKEGWEERFEAKWNVDLYLDTGAIRHGMR